MVWLAPETMYSDQGTSTTADQRVTIKAPRGTTAIIDMTGRRLRVGRTLELSPYPIYLVQDRRVRVHRHTE